MDYETFDPYDAIPFGDAMRFEDLRVQDDMDAGEGRPDVDLDPVQGPCPCAAGLPVGHAAGEADRYAWVEQCSMCDADVHETDGAPDRGPALCSDECREERRALRARLARAREGVPA